jgi:hypothetical protein
LCQVGSGFSVTASTEAGGTGGRETSNSQSLPPSRGPAENTAKIQRIAEFEAGPEFEAGKSGSEQIDEACLNDGHNPLK